MVVQLIMLAPEAPSIYHIAECENNILTGSLSRLLSTLLLLILGLCSNYLTCSRYRMPCDHTLQPFTPD